MIRMSKETDYAIILMAYLASEERGRFAARAIAEDTTLPLPMVSKVLKSLARQGLLASHRGAKGGYSLVRRPDRISMAEIIHALEGRIAMTECIEAPGECKHESVCRLKENWQIINETVMRALGGITLSDMTGPLSHRLVSLEGVRPGA